MIKYSIRIGNSNELWFLKSMLYEAVTWDHKKCIHEQKEILQSPDILKIMKDWGNRKGDIFLICQKDDGKLLGSVWYRFWENNNHSYGFVDENTPEIGIGVVKDFRRFGIGTELMNQIIKFSKNKGICSLSLSVESNNPAIYLYNKMGFKKQFLLGNSWTMLKIL